MADLTQSFETFRKSLAPSAGQEQQYGERLRALTTFMQGRYNVRESFPIGSYARGTLVPPAKDIDVLFVIGQWRAMTAPLDQLRELQRVLASQSQYANARVQRHSIGLSFNDFAIDVVPAFGGGGRYEIPELDDANDFYASSRWVETQPRDDAQRVSHSNLRTNGAAAALIATLKHSNRALGWGLKSYHLESMALDAIEARTPSGSFAIQFETLLRALSERVKTHAYSVARRRIDEYLGSDARGQLSRRLANDAATLAEAMRRGDITIARKVVPGLP